MPHWKSGLLAGAAFAALALLFLWLRMPSDWTSPLHLKVLVTEMPKGYREPIICSGKPTQADFLFLRYEGDGKALIAYDSWGGTLMESDVFNYTEGKPLELEISMPSLLQASDTDARNQGWLNVKVNGREILKREVQYFSCKATEVFFGTNPIGGTTTQGRFSGEIRAGAWPLIGRLEIPKNPQAHTLWTWFFKQPGHWITLLFLSGLAGVSFTAAQKHGLFRRRVPSPRIRTAGLAFLLAAGLCIALFAHLISYGTHRIFVTEDYGLFFEHQGRSLLEGRLDVPDFSIGGEAFVHDGKTYGYHGVTPALLRIPLIVLNIAPDKLSRAFMLLYYAAALGCVFQLLRQATKAASGTESEPPAWAIAVITLLAGLGSTLFFLSSRAYIYHEAILCGMAFALGSCTFVMAWLAEPRRHWWLGALLCGILSVNARPPTGLFALTLTGTAALWLWLQKTRQNTTANHAWFLRLATSLRSQPSLLIAAFACLLGVLSYNAISYLKFNTFESCPLRLHKQYIENPARLAKIGNKQFYAENIPFNLNGYFTGPNFKLNAHFPYFYAGNPGDNPSLSTKRIDLSEDTVAIPFSMPGLFALALGGGLCCLFFSTALRTPLIIACLALIPMGSAMFAAIAISHRYTGDFVPFLLLAGVLGLVSLGQTIQKARPLLLTALVLLTCLSAFITLALTLEYQGVKVWGVDKKVQGQYLKLKQSVDRLFSANS